MEATWKNAWVPLLMPGRGNHNAVPLPRSAFGDTQARQFGLRRVELVKASGSVEGVLRHGVGHVIPVKVGRAARPGTWCPPIASIRDDVLDCEGEVDTIGDGPKLDREKC